MNTADNYYKQITTNLSDFEINKLISLLSLYQTKNNMIKEQSEKIYNVLKFNDTFNISNEEVVKLAFKQINKNKKSESLDSGMDFQLKSDGDY